MQFRPRDSTCIGIGAYVCAWVNHTMCRAYSQIVLVINPNTIKSYKILQKLSPKHAAPGVVQLPYPSTLYTERLACLNNPHHACSWGPSLSTRQVQGSSPSPRGHAAHNFFLHRPFLLWEIVFFAPSPPTLRKC